MASALFFHGGGPLCWVVTDRHTININVSPTGASSTPTPLGYIYIVDLPSSCIFYTSAVDFHLTVILYRFKYFGIYIVAARLCLDDAAQTEVTAAPEVPAAEADPTPNVGEADAEPEVGGKTEVKKNTFWISLSCFFVVFQTNSANLPQ